jgi:hypothetical protein
MAAGRPPLNILQPDHGQNKPIPSHWQQSVALKVSPAASSSYTGPREGLS